MKLHSLQLSLSVALSLNALTTQAAIVNTGDRLSINSGVYVDSNVTGSYFAADTDGDGVISGFEKTALHQGTEGFIIGIIQGTGTPTHSGAPLETDWNRITAPYSWFGNTGQEYTTSPITGSTETGLDFSGFNWPWNGIEDIPFGSGAWGEGFTDGIANFVWDGIYGHSYTLDYRTTVEEGSPTGFGGVQFEYHFEGTVSAVPVPAAAWLFGSGLIGLIGFARRKRA
ncbi:MAG: VPLPA-CTERM sorting domain-containing protein [Gammaproteobacteria bacterium]|nr:VPLPA-CTERM sorting domain-containing protein [Gammaproteobacteria bacterium]